MRTRIGPVAASLTLLVAAGVSSCDDEPAPGAAVTDDVERSPEASDSAEGSAGDAPVEAAGAPVDEPTTVRFDLARHLPRASLRRGERRLIDLGVPGGHKYTLGRWRTRVGVDHDFDGTSASVIERETGFYVLPIPTDRHCALAIRGRSFGDRRVALYLDDETITNVQLPTDGAFETVTATIPEALCQAGEHELRLRVPRTGSLPGVGRAGVAVDWIQLGIEPEAEPTAPPSPAELVPSERTLRVPDGVGLHYAFEVPARARLTGAVLEGGALRVTVARDGEALEELGAFEGTDDGAPFAVDLARFEGEVIEVGLVARGETTVAHPAVVTPGEAPLRAAPRVDNVLIYLTDTLRADHLRVYDPQSRVQTPGLDAWARRASNLLFGHSQENWTKPSCATLLSGLFPWEHHATGEDSQVPSSVELLSEHLRAERFHTGAFVANGFVSDRFGFRQGWGSFRNYVREGRRNMARFVADDAIAWLDARPEDRPFFLYVHTIDPHVPYIPPDDDLRLYDPNPYDGVVDFHQDRTLLEGVKGGRIPLDARDREHLEALYDGEITYHDRHFARLMEALEERGLGDNTIVVFTSDHGEEFFDHDSVGHGHSVYEELIHVPLLIRWPGVTDGAQPVDEVVGLVDVMPTILDALELPSPDTLSGRSLAPLLRGGREDAPRAAVTGFMNGWRTVVVGRRKLIHRTTERWMVYDLERDPGETEDRAPDHPIEVRYLRGLLGLSLAEVREHEAASTVIDATLREQLEALGYAGASRAPTGDE